MIKDGVILAGGSGTRLLPMTSYVSKHLLNLKNKPIIDYPIQTLKNLGVENLTVILGGTHFEQIVGYLKDGTDFGLNINYIFQKEANGISSAINLCKRFLYDKNDFAVCLGDNFFQDKINISKEKNRAKIILNKHIELYRFGVASIQNDKIIKIEEKPKKINYDYANYAITGCYLFDGQFFDYFNETKPSLRGEWEVTHIIDLYHKNDKLDYSIVEGKWVDVGTFSAIDEANSILNESN